MSSNTQPPAPTTPPQKNGFLIPTKMYIAGIAMAVSAWIATDAYITNRSALTRIEKQVSDQSKEIVRLQTLIENRERCDENLDKLTEALYDVFIENRRRKKR